MNPFSFQVSFAKEKNNRERCFHEWLFDIIMIQDIEGRKKTSLV